MRFRHRVLLAIISLIVVIEGVTIVAVLGMMKSQTLRDTHTRLLAGVQAVQGAIENHRLSLAADAQGLAADPAFMRAVETQSSSEIDAVLAHHDLADDTSVVLYVDSDQRISALSGEHSIVAIHLELPIGSARDVSQRRYTQPTLALGAVNGIPQPMMVAPLSSSHEAAWIAVGSRIGDRFASQLAADVGISVSILGKNDSGVTVLASSLAADDRRLLAGGGSDPRVLTGAAEIRLASGTFLGQSREISGAPTLNLQAVVAIPINVAMGAYRSARTKMALIFSATFVLSILTARYLAAGVSRPLNRLLRAAGRISEGDYSQPIAVSGARELTQLSSALNEMQSGIAERERQIVYQAHHDILTGLPNRYSFGASLEHAVKRSQRTDIPFAIVILDLQALKGINETLGHTTGDLVLKEIALRLRAVAREADTVARLGGDDFMLLLEGATEEEAYRAAQRIVESLECIVEIDRMNIRVRINVGIVCFPRHASTIRNLMLRADIAVFAAKSSDECSIAIYESGQDEAYTRRMQLVMDLRAALDKDSLDVYFQPKIALATDRICGAEALIRWNHPELGFISPEEFIPLAEKAGYIRDLTAYVLRRVMQQLKEWRKDDLDLTIAVNLSALDLLDTQLPEAVENLLAQHGIPAHALVLEITESAVVEDPETARNTMRRLRNMGIKLSIDDFGTGQASLAHLKILPVDDLKIDKTFVLNLPQCTEDALIVKSTIELAHNMGLTVTAEGVENEAAAELLKSYGCDVIQGYLISKPLSRVAFVAWLRDKLEDRATYMIRAIDLDDIEGLIENDLGVITR